MRVRWRNKKKALKILVARPRHGRKWAFLGVALRYLELARTAYRACAKPRESEKLPRVERHTACLPLETPLFFPVCFSSASRARCPVFVSLSHNFPPLRPHCFLVQWLASGDNEKHGISRIAIFFPRQPIPCCNPRIKRIR